MGRARTDRGSDRLREDAHEEQILEFLSKQSKATSRASIALDTHLFEEEILDSFGLVEFVTFLEAQTGVSFTDDDLNDERFTSVAGILALLADRGVAVGNEETVSQ